MEFGYLNIKGIAEPLRWLFLYFRLDVKEWNPANDEEWTEKAKTLGPFASMPYLKDGDLVICETSRLPSSIPYYLIEKSGHLEFLGKDSAERAQIKIIEGILANIRQQCFNIVDMGQDADHKAALGKVFTKDGVIYRQIAALSQLLGEKEFLFDQVTWADFMLTFTARFSGAMCYSLLGYSPYADFPNIVKLMARVSNLPGIKERLDGAQGAPYLTAAMSPFRFLNFKELIDLGLNPI